MGPNSISQAMNAAAHGMDAQAHRLQVVSENLSNADTHGYKRKLITFENEMNRATGQAEVKVGNVSLDQAPGDILFDPSHPLANGEGYVTLSNVDMMIELSDAREASRSYEANLTTFKQAAQMYSGLISLLRG